MVVDAVTLLAPVVALVSVAVHVLLTASAMTGPGPTPRGWAGRPGGGCEPWVTDAVLVTDPPGPVVPWVLTLSGPDGGEVAFWSLAGYWPLKILAGPYCAVAPSASAPVIGVAEPAAGSATDGLALSAGAPAAWPHPR